MGVTRNSMKSNMLIAKSQLGSIKKTTFNNKPESFIYGMPKNPDPEGAREVTSVWKQHHANPDDLPGPDFIRMNMLATCRGMTRSPELHDFRRKHFVPMKKGEAVRKPPPPLPSDGSPAFTYGRPAAFRTAEEVRAGGPDDPLMTPLVQNAFQLDWVRANARRAHEFDVRNKFIKVRGTKGSEGHCRAAAQPASPAGEQFKLAKFKKVGAKVMPGRSLSPCSKGERVERELEGPGAEV